MSLADWVHHPADLLNPAKGCIVIMWLDEPSSPEVPMLKLTEPAHWWAIVLTLNALVLGALWMS